MKPIDGLMRACVQCLFSAPATKFNMIKLLTTMALVCNNNDPITNKKRHSDGNNFQCHFEIGIHCTFPLFQCNYLPTITPKLNVKKPLAVELNVQSEHTHPTRFSAGSDGVTYPMTIRPQVFAGPSVGIAF